MASTLGSALGTAAKATGVAVAAAATGVTALTKSAVEGYGEYEQLVGGVETLFTTSADAVQKFAENAFKSAGISTNEYMETATSFAAALTKSAASGPQVDIEQMEQDNKLQVQILKDALNEEYEAREEALKLEVEKYKEAADAKIAQISSSDKAAIQSAKKARDQQIANMKAANKQELKELKAANKEKIAQQEAANEKLIEAQVELNEQYEITAETQQKAAEYANMAIIDMADNANKMGSSMESIQNAYQGFAKQNYTIEFIYSPAA